jgi:hypothetical protein
MRNIDQIQLSLMAMADEKKIRQCYPGKSSAQA